MFYGRIPLQQGRPLSFGAKKLLLNALGKYETNNAANKETYGNNPRNILFAIVG